jgi:hypothetical protein
LGEQEKLLTQNNIIMKKITLLVASIFLVGSVANASEVMKKSGEVTRNNFSFDEPISFTERGIAFFVFRNGEFDFNTRPDDSHGDYYNKSSGRRGIENQERGVVNFGTRIEHDSFGRVRRIGNTFINYDNNNRVNRIGTVYMRYNRFALTQIGGMQIVYNYRGDIVEMHGTVKDYANYRYVYNSGNSYPDNGAHYSTSNNNESDHYYYKNDGASPRIENEREKK